MISYTTISLLILAAWSVLLGMSVVFWRSFLVLKNEKKANEFPSGEKHGSDLYWRINRAHLNSVENLAIIGAVVLVAALSGNTQLTDIAALVYLCARIFQSVCHIASNSEIVVKMRFTGLLIQYGSLIWMIVVLAARFSTQFSSY